MISMKHITKAVLACDRQLGRFKSLLVLILLLLPSNLVRGALHPRGYHHLQRSQHIPRPAIAACVGDSVRLTVLAERSIRTGIVCSGRLTRPDQKSCPGVGVISGQSDTLAERSICASTNRIQLSESAALISFNSSKSVQHAWPT